MKWNKQLVEWAGQLFCASIADILLEKKMPQVVFTTGDTKVPQVRWVMMDNEKVQMTQEEIKARMRNMKACPGKDVGFSYVHDGYRIVVLMEDMSIFPVVGAPLGTPRG